MTAHKPAKEADMPTEKRFALYYVALAADDALQTALEARYGERAGDKRYHADTYRDPALKALHDAKVAADRAWHAEMSK